jgi:hypothetical protein
MHVRILFKKRTEIFHSFNTNLFFTVKNTCAKTAKAEPFIHCGTIVVGREYPWIGAFYSSGAFRCGGNLGK